MVNHRHLGSALTALGISLLSVSTVLGGVGVPAARAATATTPGVVLPNGRLVTPLGSSIAPVAGGASYDLGDFPLGVAVSPDGTMAVASLNGRGFGSPHGFNSFCEQNQMKAGVACPGVPASVKEDPGTTAPDEGLDVIDTTTGKSTQAVVVPTSNDPKKDIACGKGFNCNGYGVTFSRDGRHVYATGGGGDNLIQFTVSSGTLSDPITVAIPSPSTQVPADPLIGNANGYPRGIATTADGKSLIVVDMYDSTIELFSLSASGAPVLLAQQLLPGGIPGQLPMAYLYGVAVSPDSQTAYVTTEGSGTLDVVSLRALAATGISRTFAPVAPAVATVTPLVGVDHPTGIAVSPDGSTLAITGTNTDNVAFVPLTAGAVAGASTLVPVGVVPRAAGVYGSAPDDVAWARDGHHAYAALAGDDADAVISVPATGAPSVTGYLPTGWYPTGIAVSPSDGRLWTVSAKGLGSRYVAGIGGYIPAAGNSLPTGSSLPSSDYYDAENMPGLLTVIPVPADAALSGDSQTAAQDVLHAGGLDQRSANNPIPAAVGGTSPIKHIVYVVRENRTFDQVFGDLALTRQDVDADPADQVLAPATPNAHSLASRYAVADHYFSDGEASIQGHWWTAAADVDDYVEKNWRQYYSPRGAASDSGVAPITTPPGCSLFQDVYGYSLTHPGFTYANFGETIGLSTTDLSTGNLTANTCRNGLPIDPASNGLSDPNYSTDLVPDDRLRAAEFLKQSGLNADGTTANNGNSLRNFNYLILSEDHTSGLAGTQTPRSEVAQNDAGLGEIISALSKSADWSSTAVFVTEDDSQDGVDHVDGHRNIAIVASPYARQVSGDGCLPGYVAQAHYDQASMVRTIELILGLQPLSAYDSGATPMYDLFQDKNSPAELTKADLEPYDVAAAPAFINETVASLPHTAQNDALTNYSKTLDTKRADIDEAGIESVLWQTVRTDPLPATAADDGNDAVAQPSLISGETASAALDSGTEPATALPESRTGVPPTLSTVTGQPITGAAPACAAPVVLTSPVAPGQTTLVAAKAPRATGRAGKVHRAAAGRPAVTMRRTLASTGLNLGLPLLGLVALAGGIALLLRRPARC